MVEKKQARQPQPLIELRSVNKKYPLASGEFYQSLFDVSLKIFEGEFVAIMGPSGSGKSTMMHIMGVLDPPTTGQFLFRGKDISHYTDDELAVIRNKEVGFVFQAFNLLPRTTVFKNVERPMLYGRVPQEDREKRVMNALSIVGIEDKANNLANHISGGQIQRAAIARAIVMDPAVILADEPTGNIDSKTANEIMNYLKKLNKQGRTIVVITHERKIAQFAERIIYLDDGRVKT